MSEIKYYTLIRYIQIASALTFAVWFSLFFNFDRAYWIPMTVMIMFGPFEEGTVAIRIKERMLGTLIGILFGVVFVATFQISDLLLYTFPLIVFVVAYFIICNYVIASTFITLTVILIFALLNPDNISPIQFGIDRVLDTMIASVICISFEFFFRPAKLTHQTIKVSIEDILKAYSSHLIHLFEAIIQKEAVSFKHVNQFYESIAYFQKQIDLSKYRLYKATFDEQKLDQIESLLQEIRMELTAIHYLVKYHRLELKSLYDKNMPIFDQLIAYYKIESQTGRLIKDIININDLNYDNKNHVETLLIESIRQIHQLFLTVWNLSDD